MNLKKIICWQPLLAGVGAGVLLISIAVGAALWLMDEETTTKTRLSDNSRVQMAMPSKSTPVAKKSPSLNTTAPDESDSGSL